MANARKNNLHNVEANGYSDYYLKIIKVGAYLSLFLPLVIIPYHLYLFSFGKVIIFRTVVEIISFFYLLLMIEKKEYRPKWGLIEIGIAVFFLLSILSSLLGVDFTKSIWGTSERMEGVFNLAHYWLFFIIIGNVFKKNDKWNKIFQTSVLVALFASFYAFGQSLYFPKLVEWSKNSAPFLHGMLDQLNTGGFFIMNNNYRPAGTVGNSGTFATYILFNIFFAAYLFLCKTGVRDRIINSIAILLLVMSLFITATRGAYIALAASVILYLLFSVLFSAGKKMKLFFLVILSIAFLLFGYVWFNKDQAWFRNDIFFSRFADFTLDESRLRTWDSAWKGWEERPLFGWGPENFNVAFNKYFDPLHFTGYSSGSWFDRAHNIFLDTLVTTGLIGLMGYLGIFLSLYYLLYRNIARIREYFPAFGLILSIPVAYFVQNFFWFDDFSTYLMLFLFFAFASHFFNNVAKFEYNLEKGKKITDLINKKLNIEKIGYRILENKSIVIGISGIILAVTIYYANIKPWIFQNTFTITVAAFEKNTDASFGWYRKAISESTYLGRQALYKNFGNYVNGVYRFKIPKDKAKQLEFKNNIDYAVSEMKNAVAENPNDVQFSLLLGRLENTRYSLFKDSEAITEAEKALRKAKELSPSRETVYYELGQTLVFKKDYKGAVEVFQKGMELNPDVPVSHWYLGMAYANAGDFQKAKEETEKAYSIGYDYRKSPDDLIGLTSIYISLKDYRKLEEIYTLALALEPNNAQFYVSLGLVNKELGNKEVSRQMIEKAISLDPTLEVEGRAFIESLK